ncbi:zinc finger protein 892 [Drosophila tropicalis]|uniref:zinc finger protein 892 n=1 Tax=Drosophila tropicalis TaxID=46794 RepID=UPI0035ABDB50
MDIEKICLTCLSLSGPFLSIYDGGSGSGNCLADMLSDFTKTKPKRQNNLPEKVCLSCLSEINHCYSFKIKCENSSRTLRQLLPNALPEEQDQVAPKPQVVTKEQEVQATASPVEMNSIEIQTDEIPVLETIHQEIKISTSSVIEDPREDDEADQGQDFEYELAQHDAPTNTEKNDGHMKYETEMDKMANEYNFSIFNNANGETEISPAPLPLPSPMQVTTRKSAAKLLQQGKGDHQEMNQPGISQETTEEFSVPPLKRSSRRRAAEKQEEQAEAPSPKRLRKSLNSNAKAIAGPTEGAVLPVAELKYHCDRCQAGFALEKSLSIHRRQNGCTNRNFKCQDCDKVFVSQDHLVEHQATHGTYNCQECGMQCESKEQLGRHMVQGHKRNLRNQCSVCQKVFTMLSTLRDHMRIHTGEKPFVCNICGKSFTQNANLRQHKLRHSETKSFKCDQCSNSFVTKAELTSHIRTHTGDKPFECDVCLAKFTTSCSLAKHKRKHTGERPYACEMCPMRFTALNVLKNHRRTHTGERPYVCMFCPKSFTQRGDCQMHQRSCGDKLYVCSRCNENFKTMAEYRKHLASHDQEQEQQAQPGKPVVHHFTLFSNKENGNAGLEEVTDEEADDNDEEEEEEEVDEEAALLL